MVINNIKKLWIFAVMILLLVININFVMAASEKDSSINHEEAADGFLKGGNYKQALSEYEKAIQNNPDNESLYIKLIYINLVTEKYDQALSYIDKIEFKNEANIKKVEDLKKKILAYKEISAGSKLLDENKNDEAEKAFQRAMAVNPEDGMIIVEIGRQYAEQFKKNAKMPYLLNCTKYTQLARAKNSDNPYIYFMSGQNMLALNSTFTADKNFKKFINLSANKQEAYLLTADTYWNYRKYNKVIKNINRAMEINPDIPFEFVLMLCAAYTQSTGSSEKAGKILQQYMKDLPKE